MPVPVRDGFLALVERRREQAREQHRHDTMLWALGASRGGKGKPPQLPAILKS